MLDELITSKTRLRLLVKFFTSQANKGYLNGLASEMGESTNSIRKELNHLYAAGYLEKTKINNKIEYNVNTTHPLYETFKKVVYKHLGIEDIVETVLDRMGDVEHILIAGDYAEGIDSGNIEIIIVGNDINYKYISQLEEKIEKLISRRVTFFLTARIPIKKNTITIYSKQK